MNQDFVLLLNPANARRLIRFQKILNMILPEGIEEISKQDLIDENCFDSIVCPYSEVKRDITQFLLDCNMRGIVMNKIHPEFSEIELINAVRISKPKSIMICSHNDSWKKACNAFFLKDIVKLKSHPKHITSQEIDDFRDGVLIIETGFNVLEYPKEIRNMGIEFAKTIVYDTNDFPSLHIFNYVWNNIITSLFPTMPISFTKKSDNKEPYMFAQLYNTCLFPEHIQTKTIFRI